MTLVLSLEDSAGRDTNIDVQPHEDFQAFLTKAKDILGYEVDLSCITKDKKVALTDNIYDFLMAVESDEEEASEEEHVNTGEETANTEDETVNTEEDTVNTDETINTEEDVAITEDETLNEEDIPQDVPQEDKIPEIVSNADGLGVIDDLQLNSDEDHGEIEVLEDMEDLELEEGEILPSQLEKVAEPKDDYCSDDEEYMQVEYLEDDTEEEGKQLEEKQVDKNLQETKMEKVDIEGNRQVREKVGLAGHISIEDGETEDLEVLDSDLECEILGMSEDQLYKPVKEEWDASAEFESALAGSRSDPTNGLPEDRQYTRSELLDMLGGSPEPPVKRRKEDSSKALLQSVFFGSKHSSSTRKPSSEQIKRLLGTVRQPTVRIEKMSNSQIKACLLNPKEFKKYCVHVMDKLNNTKKKSIASSDDDLSRYIPSQYEDIDNEGIYDLSEDQNTPSLLNKVTEHELLSVRNAADQLFGPVKKPRGRPRKYPRPPEQSRAAQELISARALEDDIARLEGLLKREPLDIDDEDYVPGKDLSWGRGKGKVHKPVVSNLVCRMCRGTVPRSELAIEHALTHKLPDRNVYPCILCPYGYTSSEEVREHMQKEHMLEQSPKKTPGRRGRKPKIHTPAPELLVPKMEPTPQDPEDELHMEDVVMLEEWLDEEQELMIKDFLQPKVEPKPEPIELPPAQLKELSQLIEPLEAMDSMQELSEGSGGEEEWLMDEQELRAELMMEDPEPRKRGRRPRSKEFHCRTCNQDFEDQSRLLHHKCTGRLRGSFRCALCGQSFTTQARLTFHRSFHQAELLGRSLHCSECPELTFADEAELYDHINAEHNHNFICNEAGCGREFHLRSSLRAHGRIHGKKRHRCEECGKIFYDIQNLKEHRITHLNVKPFQCHICLKFVNRRSRLRMHLLAHESRLPTRGAVLACRHCHMAFRDAKSAQTHLDSSKECCEALEALLGPIEEEPESESLVNNKQEDDLLAKLVNDTVVPKDEMEDQLSGGQICETIEQKYSENSDDIEELLRLTVIKKDHNDISENISTENTEEKNENIVQSDTNNSGDTNNDVNDIERVLQEIVGDSEAKKTTEGQEEVVVADNIMGLLEQVEKNEAKLMQKDEMKAIEKDHPDSLKVDPDVAQTSEGQNMQESEENNDLIEKSNSLINATNEDKEGISMDTDSTQVIGELVMAGQEAEQNAENPQTEEAATMEGQECLPEVITPQQQEVQADGLQEAVEEIQGDLVTMAEYPEQQELTVEAPVEPVEATSLNEFKGDIIAGEDKSLDTQEQDQEVQPEQLLEGVPTKSKRLLEAVTVSMVYRCEYCEKVFWQKESLNQHRLVHRGQKMPFICNICQAAFTTYARCTSHKTSHGFYKANPDSDLTERSAQQVTACEAFPVVKHFLCEVCDKTFLHWTYLQVHRRQKHGDKDFFFVCRYCGEKFHESWMLNFHRKKVHLDELNQQVKSANTSYKCADCGEGFNMRKDLAHHMDVEHNDSSLLRPKKPPGPFRCVSCNKEYRTKVGLDGHMRIHNGGVYLCALCGNGFAHRAGLETHHKRVHLREQRHSCKVCGQAFFSAAELDGHSRCHTGEKPFPCSYCEMYFRTKGRRNEHHRIHTGERPYPCDICGLAFRRSHAMKNHRLIHTGERQHRCPHCLKLFHVRSNLNTHIKTKHPGQFLVLEVQGGAKVRAALEESLQMLASSDCCQTVNEDDPDTPDTQYEFQQEELEYAEDDVSEAKEFVKQDEVEEIQYVEDHGQIEENMTYIDGDAPVVYDKGEEEMAVQYAVEGDGEVQYLVEQVEQEGGSVQYAIKYVQAAPNS